MISVHDESELLASLVPLGVARVIEPGRVKAEFARRPAAFAPLVYRRILWR